MSIRLLAAVVALTLCFLSPAAAQIELPPGNVLDRITVAADRGTHWIEGEYDVYLLDGTCYVNQGLTYARSQQAVVWIERGDATRYEPRKVMVYLEGDVEIKYQDNAPAQPGGIAGAATATLKDRTWFGRFYSAAQVDVRPIALAQPPSNRPEIYTRAASHFELRRPGQAQQAQFAEPITPPPATVVPPPDMLRIRVQSRSHTPLEFHSVPRKSSRSRSSKMPTSSSTAWKASARSTSTPTTS